MFVSTPITIVAVSTYGYVHVVVIIVRNMIPSSSLTNLWQHVQDAASSSLSVSLDFWQQANEYLSERLGNLLYFDPPQSDFPHQSMSEMPVFL